MIDNIRDPLLTKHKTFYSLLLLLLPTPILSGVSFTSLRQFLPAFSYTFFSFKTFSLYFYIFYVFRLSIALSHPILPSLNSIACFYLFSSFLLYKCASHFNYLSSVA